MATEEPDVDQTQNIHTIDGTQFHDTYTYESLKEPQSQIRLLHLRPERVTISKSSNDDESSHIESTFNCSIETIDLHYDVPTDIPPYYAISYVWGNATDLRPVVCNGQIKQVTQNLWQILLQYWIRTYGDLKSDNISQIVGFAHPLWIDAICINQDDLVEKGHQVQQMGLIYSRAARVILWLGPYHEIAEDAQGIMVPLDTKGTFDYDPCPPRPDGLTTLVDLDTKWESQADREEMLEHLDHILGQFSEDNWKRLDAFVALMDLEYWSRAWVIQEVALADTNQAIVMIGSKIWAWATLVNAAHTLMVIMYLYNAGKDWATIREWPRDKIFTLRYYSVVLAQFVSGTMSAKPHTLAEHIPRAIFRTTNATLQVDHVYSLLSLASDQRTCGIFPDYTKSVTEVYQGVTQYLLRIVGAEALTFCEICRTSKLNLPSWVPDFSEHNIKTFKPPRAISNYPRIYSAGGPREHFSYQTQGKTLHLRGRKVDTICHFANFAADYKDFERENAPGWLRSFRDFVDEAVESHGTDSTDAWRVPIADQIDANGSIGVRAPAETSDAYDELLGHDGMTKLSRAAVNYSRALAMWGACHAPFVTRLGYLGLGRPCARKDDVLFICTGADTPLILREVEGGKFVIVAETFLQGFMDGEILKSEIEEVGIEVV